MSQFCLTVSPHTTRGSHHQNTTPPLPDPYYFFVYSLYTIHLYALMTYDMITAGDWELQENAYIHNNSVFLIYQ